VAPALPPWEAPAPPACDHFDGDRLGPAWNFVRTPRVVRASLRKRPGFLRLDLAPETLDGAEGSPAFVGRRVQHGSYVVRTRIDFSPRADGDGAGVAIRNGGHHLRFMRTRSGGRHVLQVVAHQGKREVVLAEIPAPAGPLHLKVSSRAEIAYGFWYAVQPERWLPVAVGVDGRLLGHRAAPGAIFTGAYVGPYATGPGRADGVSADFDFFEYRPAE
jgi:alpha-N-arabinofuranosidase